MTANLEGFLAECRQRCETSLAALAGPAEAPADDSSGSLDTLYSASRYSLLNAGKRIRPILVFAAARAVDPAVSLQTLDHPACAMEMIHVYSLVHDDLPAMDDDDLRRGKPSCHRAYDEAVAILVGDGLQARAFELLATAPGFTAAQRLDMVRLLAAAAGVGGMVGGQAIDIAATGSDLDLGQLQTMHKLKTGALIRAALGLGGIATQASARQLQALDTYGSHIGLAFQVVDDILDVEESTANLGKTGGKDGAANKPTYVKLLGLEGARAEAGRLLAQAQDALQDFAESADPLREIAAYIVHRRH